MIVQDWETLPIAFGTQRNAWQIMAWPPASTILHLHWRALWAHCLVDPATKRCSMSLLEYATRAGREAASCATGCFGFRPKFFRTCSFIAKDMHKLHQTFAQKIHVGSKPCHGYTTLALGSPAARSTDRNAEGIFMKGTAPAWACESASNVEAKPGTFLLEQPWGILGPYITRQLLKIHVIFQEHFLALQKVNLGSCFLVVWWAERSTCKTQHVGPPKKLAILQVQGQPARLATLPSQNKGFPASWSRKHIRNASTI